MMYLRSTLGSLLLFSYVLCWAIDVVIPSQGSEDQKEPVTAIPNTATFRPTEAPVTVVDPIPIDIYSTEITNTAITLKWGVHKGATHDNNTNITYIKVANYTLVYYPADHPSDQTVIPLLADQQNYTIGNLSPGTAYKVYLNTTYTTGLTTQKASGNPILIHGYKTDAQCNCNPVGSTGSCDHLTGHCYCKDNNTRGVKCDSCMESYYWVTEEGCKPCPCSKPGYHSDGTCTLNRDANVAECTCLDGFIGRHCNFCPPGKYRQNVTTGHHISETCGVCHCNNNTASKENMCHRETGVCQECLYGSTGDHCELCMEGYDGDATTERGCVYRVAASTEVVALVLGVIAASLLVIAVSIIIYKKKCKRSDPFKLWAIRLDDDHEQVNFSAMMEPPAYSSNYDDPQFFGGSSPRSIVKSPKKSSRPSGSAAYRTINGGGVM